MLRLVTFLFLAMASTTLTTAQSKVHVSIYYESLCPDSIKFITKQFYPTWQKMMNEMSVDFVPYGNSNTSTDDDGRIYFECQHGPSECYGNKVQACAVSHMSPENQVKFINCVMSSKSTNTSGLECATELQMNYKPIDTCVTSNEGNIVLERLGKKTKDNSVKSVPTIIFNDKFVQADQDKAVADFMSALCDHIMGDKPAECKSGGHSSASSLVPALATVAFVTLASAL